MFLVKSCFRRDNIRERKTIKIGTLTEYRDTEEQQIADRHEGKINLTFDLNNFHMAKGIFNQINTFRHASSNFFLHDVQLRPNPLFKDQLYAKRYSATSSLIKSNRFIFCISELTDPHMCHDIFKDYDDFWYLRRGTAMLFGQALSLSVLNEIAARTRNGEDLFTTNISNEYIEVKWYCKRILYTPREIHIDNVKLYTDYQNILYCLSEGHMVKPINFQHEREFRFIFDIYCKGSLLQPLNKPLFVNAENIFPLIK